MARRPILERAIMDRLWDDGGWLTTDEVRTRLDRDLAYTTVMTTLSRLWRKGRLERRRRGRAFEYHATTGREQYLAEQMEEILTAAADRKTALARFVDELPASDRRRLRELLGDR